ncbi:uncharacterized protein TNCV_1760811 [Trichonephila clavipes]|nr:uncharacterized protein TNCV_1760811 [Trichonephila clavipes]
MFNKFRGAWSVNKPYSIVLGVMNWLNRKQLHISANESLPMLTWSPSQNFSASSEPYKFLFFFSEKLNFSQLVRLQYKLRFCYSPHLSVTFPHVTSDLSDGNPQTSLDSLLIL